MKRKYTPEEKRNLDAIGRVLYDAAGLSPKSKDRRLRYQYDIISGPAITNIVLMGIDHSKLNAVKNQQVLEQINYVTMGDSDLMLRVSFQRGAIVIEIPKDDHERQLVLINKMEEKGLCSVNMDVALGVPNMMTNDVYTNRHLMPTVDFLDRSKGHVLAAGSTGSGKSVTLQKIGRDALMEQDLTVGVIIIDLSKDGEDYEMFSVASKNLCHPIITNPNEAMALIRFLEANSALIQKHFDVFVVIFDEISDAKSKMDPVFSMFERQLSLLRSRHVKFVLATQRPTKELVGSAAIKEHCTIRIGGRVTDGTNSQLIMENQELLFLTGKGDMMLKNGTSKIIRYVSPLVVKDDTVLIPTSDTINRLPLHNYGYNQEVQDTNELQQDDGNPYQLCSPEVLFQTFMSKSDNDLRMNGNVYSTPKGDKVVQIGGPKRKLIKQRSEQLIQMLHDISSRTKRPVNLDKLEASDGGN